MSATAEVRRGGILASGLVGATTPGVYAKQPCGCSIVVIDWDKSCPYTMAFFATPDDLPSCERHSPDDIRAIWTGFFGPMNERPL